MAVGLADLARAASVVAHPGTTEGVRGAFESETASDLDDLVVVQVSAGQLPGLRGGSRVAGACEPGWSDAVDINGEVDRRLDAIGHWPEQCLLLRGDQGWRVVPQLPVLKGLDALEEEVSAALGGNGRAPPAESLRQQDATVRQKESENLPRQGKSEGRGVEICQKPMPRSPS
jgi:hypothetical protein